MSSVSEKNSEKAPADEAPTVSERIPAAERREQILAAASTVFGERGYSGTTTDQVAQAAGISQPYVVRMFGGKENLFVEVLGRALDKLTIAFQTAIDASKAAGEDSATRSNRMGAAYADLIADRGILMSLMQGFIMGHDPVIGASARTGFLSIYRLLREDAGMEADDVVTFLAHGMLFNTLVAMRMPDEYGHDLQATELVDCTFRTKLDMVLGIVTQASQAAQRTAANPA
jgi:TetR/AcrR family transcriptional regulator